MEQGFIPTKDLTAVRVRVAGHRAWLTLKGASTGATRSEFEYPIPVADARQMIAEFCGGKVISKTRYRMTYSDHLWEIDVFSGDNAGLILAEVELAEGGRSSPPAALGRPGGYRGQSTTSTPTCMITPTVNGVASVLPAGISNQVGHVGYQ